MQVGPFWLITVGTLKGPWHVSAYQNAWHIVNIIKEKSGGIECKKIGKVRGHGMNYCDRAREIARERNDLFLKEHRDQLPLYLGICSEFDKTIAEALRS